MLKICKLLSLISMKYVANHCVQSSPSPSSNCILMLITDLPFTSPPNLYDSDRMRLSRLLARQANRSSVKGMSAQCIPFRAHPQSPAFCNRHYVLGFIDLCTHQLINPSSSWSKFSQRHHQAFHNPNSIP